MVSRHLGLPPLPLAPTVLSTPLGSSSCISTRSSARFSLLLFQLNAPTTALAPAILSFTLCSQNYLPKAVPHPISHLLANMWWFSVALEQSWKPVVWHSGSSTFESMPSILVVPPRVLPRLCPMLQRKLHGHFSSACIAVSPFLPRPSQRLSPPGSLPCFTRTAVIYCQGTL